MPKTIYASVSIFVEVNDVAAVVRSARQRMVDDGLDEDYVNDAIPDDDVSTALRMLLDPGSMCNGAAVLDSECEITGQED
jgi:hypothetical protein